MHNWCVGGKARNPRACLSIEGLENLVLITKNPYCSLLCELTSSNSGVFRKYVLPWIPILTKGTIGKVSNPWFFQIATKTLRQKASHPGYDPGYFPDFLLPLEPDTSTPVRSPSLGPPWQGAQSETVRDAAWLSHFYHCFLNFFFQLTRDVQRV